MIYYSVPYTNDKNIGKYYNSFVDLLPNDEDWVCFIDADTIFLTPNYGHLIEEAIKYNTNFSVFTCFTNRIGNPKQSVHNLDMKLNCEEYEQYRKIYNGDKIDEHRKIAKEIQDKYGSKVIDMDEFLSNTYGDALLSGVMIMAQKKTIKDTPFKEEGMLGVDNSFHKDLQAKGLKIGLMKGLYIYHWHRGGKNTTHHLI